MEGNKKRFKSRFNRPNILVFIRSSDMFFHCNTNLFISQVNTLAEDDWHIPLIHTIVFLIHPLIENVCIQYPTNMDLRTHKQTVNYCTTGHQTTRKQISLYLICIRLHCLKKVCLKVDSAASSRFSFDTILSQCSMRLDYNVQ